MEKTKIDVSIMDNTQDDINYTNLIKIYNQIIPEKLEEAYVSLSELISNYDATNRKIKELEKKASEIKKQLKKQQQHEQNEIELRSKIKEVASTIENETDLKGYEALSQLISSAEEEHVMNSKIKKETEGKLSEIETQINEQKKSLENTIARIINQINSMRTQDITVNKIGTVDNYLSLIDGFESTPEIKQAYKNILASYTNLRKQLFRHEEELAMSIIDYFNKQNEPLDTSLDKSIGVVTYAEQINIGKKNMESGLRTISAANTQYNIQLLNTQSIFMNAAANYLENGEFDREAIETFFLHGVKMEEPYSDLYRELINSPAKDNHHQLDQSLREKAKKEAQSKRLSEIYGQTLLDNEEFDRQKEEKERAEKQATLEKYKAINEEYNKKSVFGKLYAKLTGKTAELEAEKEEYGKNENGDSRNLDMSNEGRSR